MHLQLVELSKVAKGGWDRSADEVLRKEAEDQNSTRN